MARPLRAIPERNWQGTADPARAVARRHAPALARAMRAAFRQLRLLVNTRDLAGHLKRADIRQAIAAVPLDHYHEVLRDAFAVAGVAFDDAAKLGAGKIRESMRRGGHQLRYRKPGAFRKDEVGQGYAWDRLDDKTLKLLRRYQDRMIRELGSDARDTIAEMVEYGVRHGLTMDEVAANIRSTIMLTTRQAQAVANYRRLLQEADPQALARQLRDKSRDDLVQAAIDGRPPPTRVNWDRATVSAGRPIGDNQVVLNVPVRALDAAARKDQELYIAEPKLQVAHYAESGQTMSIPEVGAANGRITFTNGRNRFAAARALGDRTIPIAVDAGNEDEVLDAIGAGEVERVAGLTSEEVDDLVDAYAENYLDYRAGTIAGTESLRASNIGLRDSYRQAADRGVFDADAVTRHWQIAQDEKVCPVCRSIVENNPDGVGLEEDFQSDDGPIDDAPVHTSCRCTVEYVTDLDA